MLFADLKSRKHVLLLLKLLIGLGTLYILFKAVFREGIVPEEWIYRLWQAARSGNEQLLLLAFTLIPVNWGLEALKWQLLSRKIEPLSWAQAYRAVLVGSCLGFITPSFLGDYAGRILALQSPHRLRAFGAISLGRFCQLLLTLTAGSVAMIYFALQPGELPARAFLTGLLVLLGGINLSAYLLLFNPRFFLSIIAALPLVQKAMPYLAVIGRYATREISWLLLWSTLRYLVFMSQFLLVLAAFNVRPGLLPMSMGVAATFLFKTVAPSFNALTDLGMRELSAMYFFKLLGQDLPQVMAASLSLWLMNIALPSLLGFAFVWQLKHHHLGVKDRIKKMMGKH